MKPLENVRWDAIVIGGGHNGLVMSALLAMRGKRVLVLEQRHVLGGACVTEEFEGCLVSRTSYVLSMFPRKLVDGLALREHGLVLLDRNPNSFTPLRDGRYLLRYKEWSRTAAEIAKFRERDVEGYRKLTDDLGRLSLFAERLMSRPPPDPFRKRDWPAMLGLLMKAHGLGQGDLRRMMRLMSASAHDFVAEYVQSEPLVGAVSSDGIIGMAGGPFTPGTGYVLVHHDMGDLGEHRGEWFLVQGGMGGLAKAIASCASMYGAELMTNADVVRIVTEKTRRGRRATGVMLRDGRVFRARSVISSADAHQTFFRMCDLNDLPLGFLAEKDRIDYSSMSFKVNMIVERSDARKLTWHCGVPTPPGTIHLLEDSRYVQRCYHEAWEGRIPDDLVLELVVPSVRDATLCPSGDRDVVSVFGQYVPYRLADGRAWDEPARGELLRKVLAVMDRYCNASEVFIAADVLAPTDLEREFRLTGGNIFQGAMRLDQLLFMRTPYETPIAGLFMCGSATHPGGGVTGLNALHASRKVLKYL